MKALMPSHREKKRYIKVAGQDLKKNIRKAVKDFAGNFGLSKCSINFIEVEEDFAIISINRDSVDLFKASISIFKEKMQTIKVSGTLKALKSQE